MAPRKQVQIDTGENFAVSREFELPDNVLDRGGETEIITGEAVKAAGNLNYQKLLAFMEEKVVVQVSTTTDKNAEPLPAVYVNGVAQFFPRGQNITCKRKFVEGLARSKPEMVNTDMTVQSLGAEPQNRVLRTSALRYPFHVVHDANPRGAKWLEQLLTEDRV